MHILRFYSAFNHCRYNIARSLFGPYITFTQSLSYLGKWQSPEGFDTGINVYNSASNQKVPLKLKNKNIATWYMCGPTVYAESHIGHASCYVKFDIIRRIMENMFNLNVLLMMGITDIDDKIIKKSKEVGMTIFQLSKKYELDFFNDMKAMRVKLPVIVSRVTDNIPFIISFCQTLIDKNYAYVTEKGNVYFMVSKSISASIMNQIPEDLEVITDPLKKDPRDFVLWKAAKIDEPYWFSPWGKGRPGWHIECSVMASHIFGSQLDIHSGGYDLLFPHHVNEKSQSEAFHTCSQWVNYWFHAGLLQVGDDMKMSKSLGNTISVKDFLKNNCVNDFRILCLQSLYRKNISYNAETLAGAEALHKKFHTFINECELYLSGKMKCLVIDGNKLLNRLDNTQQQITSELSDDFNTSQGLMCLIDLVDEVNKCIKPTNSPPISSTNMMILGACFSYVHKMLETFGISITCRKTLPNSFVDAVDAFVEFRNQIRLLAMGQNKIETEYIFQHIDEAYTSLHQKIGSFGEIEQFSEICDDMSQAASDLREQALNTANKLCKANGKFKNKQEELRIFFTFCDEFRSTLEKIGIAIKDRGNISTWIPLTYLQKKNMMY